MKESYEILIQFLIWAVEKRACDRYRSAIETKSGELVFCAALCHKFESQVRGETLNNYKFSEAAALPCRVYISGMEFGKRFDSLKDAFGVLELADSWLIVTEDSRYGLHRGEWYHDRDLHFVLPQ